MIGKILPAVFALTVFFAFSCRTPAHCRDCKEERSVKFQMENIPFSDASSALYKVKINLYSMYFSGLLAMKNEGNGRFRMTLMSETGFKLFDMEIKDGSAKLSNVFPELDRPSVIKTFEEDFALMVLSGIRGRNCRLFSFEESSDNLFVCRSENKDTGIIVNTEKGVIKKMWVSEKMGHPYFEINYGYGENGLTPDFITIVHSNVRLRIELAILEKK
jgi:hypothetical protein